MIRKSDLINSSSAKCAIYALLVVIEVILINHVSDLNPALENWVPKIRELAKFSIPSDNFYGPGAAILLLPFFVLFQNLFIANLFYSVLGAVAFWKICNQISINWIRNIAKLSLFCNFYLFWLINSSQDTVFEFCLLSWSVLFLMRKSYLNFTLVTFLLCLTRAGYWAYFLSVSIVLLFIHFKTEKKNWKIALSIPIFLFSSIFNYVNYNSPSPALEGGITAYFSYSKYHYLALPKMDMDVFLSGPRGTFSRDFGPEIPENASQAEVNSIYQKAAFDSAIQNKKETILGWMQKFDSYFFDVQKVPHLPGSYVLNQENQTIAIGQERLSWPLVIGSLAYMFYRTILFVFGMLALGALIFYRFLANSEKPLKLSLFVAVFPYLFGLIPGLLFYTETRFKIVTELMLVPLICQIWSNLVEKKRVNV